MEIKPKDITDFKKLYVQHFGIELTNGLARTKLLMLVRQMEIVYQPLTDQQIKYVNEYVNERRPDDNSRAF